MMMMMMAAVWQCAAIVICTTYISIVSLGFPTTHICCIMCAVYAETEKRWKIVRITSQVHTIQTHQMEHIRVSIATITLAAYMHMKTLLRDNRNKSMQSIFSGHIYKHRDDKCTAAASAHAHTYTEIRAEFAWFVLNHPSRNDGARIGTRKRRNGGLVLSRSVGSHGNDWFAHRTTTPIYKLTLRGDSSCSVMRSL